MPREGADRLVVEPEVQTGREPPEEEQREDDMTHIPDLEGEHRACWGEGRGDDGYHGFMNLYPHDPGVYPLLQCLAAAESKAWEAEFKGKEKEGGQEATKGEEDSQKDETELKQKPEGEVRVGCISSKGCIAS